MREPGKYKEKPTGAKRTIDGVVFYSWSVGILSYEWRTEDDRIRVGSNGPHRSTYSASVDGVGLGKRFRSQETAARAALKVLRTQEGAGK